MTCSRRASRMLGVNFLIWLHKNLWSVRTRNKSSQPKRLEITSTARLVYVIHRIFWSLRRRSVPSVSLRYFSAETKDMVLPEPAPAIIEKHCFASKQSLISLSAFVSRKFCILISIILPHLPFIRPSFSPASISPLQYTEALPSRHQMRQYQEQTRSS